MKIAEYLKLYSGKKLLIKFKELHKKEYLFTMSSIKKIKKDFKWSPKISLKKSILSYYKHLLIR